MEVKFCSQLHKVDAKSVNIRVLNLEISLLTLEIFTHSRVFSCQVLIFTGIHATCTRIIHYSAITAVKTPFLAFLC